MIVTLTANPSHDRTVSLAGAAPARRGAARRVGDLAGRRQGRQHLARLASPPASPHDRGAARAAKDDPFVLELLAAGIDCRPVPHEGDLRVNITITEPDGTTTKLNSPGPQVDPADCSPRSPRRWSPRRRQADWVVLAGSLPPGAPADWYAELVTALRGAGARVAVDTSDAPARGPRRRAPDAAAPHLMKPNGEELASFTGHDADELEADPRRRRRARPGPCRRAGSRACWSPSARTAPSWSTPTGAWHATPPPTTVVSTVGAGDSSLFGYLLGDVAGRSPDQRLALAVAYGSAAAGLPGTTIPSPIRCDPTSSGRAPRPHPRSVTHDRPDHRRPGAPRRRPRRRQARRHPRAGPVVADAGRADRRRPAGRRTPSPARRPSATGLPGGIAIPHCRTDRRRRSRPWPSPGSRPRSTSAPRTARPTWPS